MNPREKGFLLLTSHLGNPDRKVLTTAQLRILADRVQLIGKPPEDRDLKTSDLMALGYPRTPELGKALNRLLELVIAGEVPNEKETLLQQAEQWLENK